MVISWYYRVYKISTDTIICVFSHMWLAIMVPTTTVWCLHGEHLTFRNHAQDKWRNSRGFCVILSLIYYDFQSCRIKVDIIQTKQQAMWIVGWSQVLKTRFQIIVFAWCSHSSYSWKLCTYIKQENDNVITMHESGGENHVETIA